MIPMIFHYTDQCVPQLCMLLILVDIGYIFPVFKKLFLFHFTYQPQSLPPLLMLSPLYFLNIHTHPTHACMCIHVHAFWAPSHGYQRKEFRIKILSLSCTEVDFKAQWLEHPLVVELSWGGARLPALGQHPRGYYIPCLGYLRQGDGGTGWNKHWEPCFMYGSEAFLENAGILEKQLLVIDIFYSWRSQSAACLTDTSWEPVSEPCRVQERAGKKAQGVICTVSGLV